MRILTRMIGVAFTAAATVAIISAAPAGATAADCSSGLTALKVHTTQRAAICQAVGDAAAGGITSETERQALYDGCVSQMTGTGLDVDRARRLCGAAIASPTR